MSNIIPTPPAHPGKFLKNLLLEKNISSYRLSSITKIPQSRLSLILAGNRSITPDTALRLAAVFPEYPPDRWLLLQAEFDLYVSCLENGAEYKSISLNNYV